MSAIDRLLDDYEAVAEAASRLLESKDHLVGEHEQCCEAGQCLKCDEAYIQAEADLHRALAKVAPGPFRPGAHHDSGNGSGPGTQQEIKDLRGNPAEYLRRFFSELERLKHLPSCDVSHAVGFRDGKPHVLMSIGDFRERVSVQTWIKIPLVLQRTYFFSGGRHPGLTSRSSRFSVKRAQVGALSLELLVQ